MSWIAYLLLIVAGLWLAERAVSWWLGERLSLGDWLRGLWK